MSKGTLIADLVERGVLHVDSNQKLLEKWVAGPDDQEGKKPDIFNVIASDQSGRLSDFLLIFREKLNPDCGGMRLFRNRLSILRDELAR